MHKHLTEKKIPTKTLLSALLVIGILCFGIAAILSFQLASRIHRMQFPIPREANINQIESWMTIRYISRAYHIPEEEFIRKLSLSPESVKTKSVEKIAKQKNIDTDVLITQIKQLIIDFSPAHTRPNIQIN